jgi:hypothetical protein
MRHFLALAVLFIGLMATPVVADQEKVAILQPTKERLIVFWEDTLRADPQVKKLEETKEKGVYNFETTFFPYKGRLKLLNAAIFPYDGGYYEGLSTGIIEVELPDAPESFFRKHAASYNAWTRLNHFYHDEKGGVWFPINKLADWSKEYNKREYATTAATAEAIAANANMNSWWQDNRIFVYLAALIAIIVFVERVINKQNKKIWENHARALEEQQRGLRIGEESLKHQLEHTRLLNEILAQLKK